MGHPQRHFRFRFLSFRTSKKAPPLPFQERPPSAAAHLPLRTRGAAALHPASPPPVGRRRKRTHEKGFVSDRSPWRHHWGGLSLLSLWQWNWFAASLPRLRMTKRRREKRRTMMKRQVGCRPFLFLRRRRIRGEGLLRGLQDDRTPLPVLSAGPHTIAFPVQRCIPPPPRTIDALPIAPDEHPNTGPTTFAPFALVAG